MDIIAAYHRPKISEFTSRSSPSAQNSQVFMPPNGSTVTLNYQETRMIKALGSIVSAHASLLFFSQAVCVQLNKP